MSALVAGLTSVATATQQADRRAWPASLTVSAYGRSIEVRVNDADILRLIPRHLPYGWRPAKRSAADRLYSIVTSGRSRRRYMLFDGAEPVADSPQLGEILEALEARARWFVAEHARSRVFIHAAVVGWKGRAILIPGKSMSGKTTLAAEFVRAGATYYSDEYAVLDARGRVHPYAKALSIRSAEDGYTQTDYPVEAFGGKAGSRPLPVGIVLMTQYKSGARWRPRVTSAGVGAMSLLANAVAARSEPDRTMDALQRALTSPIILKSNRGEAREVVASVLDFPNSAYRFGRSGVGVDNE
ncbi:MAG TPA: hypothetical protein VM120_24085 [Bryobacteraceae bacterium]|nr:hypothetical protein [Bryobacteraceae bacterium]